jgi:hypothetical protein
MRGASRAALIAEEPGDGSIQHSPPVPFTIIVKERATAMARDNLPYSQQLQAEKRELEVAVITLEELQADNDAQFKQKVCAPCMSPHIHCSRLTAPNYRQILGRRSRREAEHTGIGAQCSGSTSNLAAGKPG